MIFFFSFKYSSPGFLPLYTKLSRDIFLCGAVGDPRHHLSPRPRRDLRFVTCVGVVRLDRIARPKATTTTSLDSMTIIVVYDLPVANGVVCARRDTREKPQPLISDSPRIR